MDRLRSSSILRLFASTSSTFGEFCKETLVRSGSPFTIALRFLTESNAPHCFLSRANSASAPLSSSRSSRTFLSCAAIAWIKSFASVGDRTVGVSLGVGGKEGAVVEIGVGLDGAFDGKAIGKVNDNLFEFRDVVDNERVDRAPKEDGGDSNASSVGGGGGGIASEEESLDTWPRLLPDCDLRWTGRCGGVESSMMSYSLCVELRAEVLLGVRDFGTGFLGDGCGDGTTLEWLKLCDTC